MPVLTTYPIALLERLVPETSQHSRLFTLDQSMNSRHTCLCCSNLLLRHICLGRLYWRCSHCYQAMPVMEDAQVMPLLVTHGQSFQPLLISLLLQGQRNCEQTGREQSDPTNPNVAMTPMMIHSG